MDKSRSTPELRARYKAALSRALLAGYAVLAAGGEAMDAAVAALSSMEGASHNTQQSRTRKRGVSDMQTARYSTPARAQCST